jgi:N,N-dimethylformamidase
VQGELQGKKARVLQEPLRTFVLDETAAAAEAEVGGWDGGAGTVVLAAWQEGTGVGRHFNGKIEAPTIRASGEVAAAWDLALREPGSMEIVDTGPRRLNGRCLNMPMRAVTGSRWTGEEHEWRRAPDEYAAVHFHDDDLEDAGWDADFELQVPDTLRSGIYAARLRTESGAEDYLPFVVRPMAAGSRIAYLVPTLSYLAYGSEHLLLAASTVPKLDHPTEPVDLDIYSYEHKLRSLYDVHTDGRGVALATRLRPQTNLRPKYVMPAIGFPHQFNADLNLVDWLDAKGHEADFVTDEDLHEGGWELLRDYRVVLTGTHPEYWTLPMLDALEEYLDNGGRFVYLGGNGLYWVTGIDPERPHVIEVRRANRGTGTWRSEEGETYLQTTGERGGMWRERNRAPQRYVGVGMAAQGFDKALPYARQPDSYDPRVSWIFDGVDEHPIGGYGLWIGGAGGQEIDRYDQTLGTPPHALLPATATSFSDSYQHAIEEVEMSDSLQGGSVEPRVRADMTFFETPNGGAVFSVGSICWCSALSWNGYENGVSRITDNVVRRFAADKPL